MKKILLLILLPIVSYSQTKIGNSINGKYPVSSGMASSFGTRLSLSGDGNILAVGDQSIWSGEVRVYINTANNWEELGSKISIGNSPDEKGKSISLSKDGSILAVGSPQGAGNGYETGFAQVYQNIAGIWTQVGTNIKGKAGGEYSGSSISLSEDGSTIAIGAPGNSQNKWQGGCVRAYKNVGDIWTKIGDDLYGKQDADNFGSRVVLANNGEIMAIGNKNKSISVFKNIAGTWTLLGNEITGINSGFSFSADGSTIAVPYTVIDYAPITYYRIITSYVKLLRLINGIWTQVGISLKGNGEYSNFGSAISLSNDGSIIAIGAPGKDEKGDESGIVMVYKENSGNWLKLGIDIKGEAKYDRNGEGVSLSSDGTKLAVGSPYNDNVTGANAGAIRIFNLLPFLNTDQFVMSNFNLYPNPASEIVNVNLQDNFIIKKINIYNSLGQFIKTDNTDKINISSLSKGIYYFEIITDKGKGTKAIIVN
ncbi:hypothetical protein DMB65_18665 [Flavobacterium cheongpyeongense]|uniref:Secretion system C-terminal sorting domain-containing protein n=1 Tax=Flavobacterium cheongpyeongense TaxID=2212651 RepID=A0A2V4BL56_9FLAO|nr:T9SS type A sorting domain-containing protein [Flavobacterium cheongpyeongense]PXY39272.1 hypothetical protein DMB65_18665 [Flavobacterium cheongpyeongense]